MCTQLLRMYVLFIYIYARAYTYVYIHTYANGCVSTYFYIYTPNFVYLYMYTRTPNQNKNNKRVSNIDFQKPSGSVPSSACAAKPAPSARKNVPLTTPGVLRKALYLIADVRCIYIYTYTHVYTHTYTSAGPREYRKVCPCADLHVSIYLHAYPSISVKRISTYAGCLSTTDLFRRSNRSFHTSSADRPKL